jgi:uncharacterized protein YbgA (DUF1722 family)
MVVFSGIVLPYPAETLYPSLSVVSINIESVTWMVRYAKAFDILLAVLLWHRPRSSAGQRCRKKQLRVTGGIRRKLIDAVISQAEASLHQGRPISERTHAESGPASDGVLTNYLSSEDKQELPGLIEDYRQGLVPLIVPLTLLKHHLNRHPVPEWVHQQVYLHPYPKELMLRSHV